MYRFCIPFIFLLFVFQQAWGGSIQLDNMDATQSVGKALEYFSLAASDDLTFAEAKTHSAWKQSLEEVPNFGFSSDHYWFRFVIQPPTNPDNYILNIEYALLDLVEIFITKNGVLIDTMRSGNEVSFSERRIKHRALLFPLNLDAHSNYEIYVHAYGKKSVQLPISMTHVQYFWERDQAKTLYQGLYYGIIAVMMLYNLFLFYSLKQNTYLCYVLMVASIGLFQLALTGVGYAHVWTHFEWWNKQSIAVLIPACNGFSSLFAYKFLNMQTLAPFTARVHLFLAKCSFVALFFAFFLPPDYTVPFSTVLTFCSSCFVTVILFRFWSQSRSTMYFGIAWTVLLIGSETIALNKLGLIPYNFFTENALQFGSAFESILLSLAMGEQIKQLQQDKINAEKAEFIARENALLLSQKELEARNATKAKSDFLAAMSHEIRTPMNGVLGIAELLKDTALTTTQTEYVDIIYSSGKSLITIINDILDYSKIEAGKLSFEIIQFDIDKLLEETVSLFSNRVEKSQIQLIAIRHDAVPKMLQGDPGRIKQILLNFIGNAYKFTESGFIVIRVNVEEKNADKIMLKFEIQDTGIGMSATQQEKLFNQYVQADDSIARKYGGTGLGLTISKGLAELMGGSTGVNSTLGEGSIFWFTTLMAFPAESTQLISRTLNENVLLISNNLLGNHFLPELFHASGYTVSLLDDTQSIVTLEPDYFSNFEKIVLYWTEDESELAKFLAILKEKKNHSPLYVISGIPKEKIQGDIVVISPPLYRNKIVHNLLKSHASKPVLSQLVQHKNISCNVLVAEDNPVNKIVLKGFLKRYKVDYIFAENGEIAVELFKKSAVKFDIILMDCEMPILDGYQATKQIREWEAENVLSRTPIVALTAHALQEYRDKAQQADMDDYLTKPVDPVALESLLKRYARRLAG